MEVEIIEKPLRLELYGFSGPAFNKDYAGTAYKLSAKVWEAVKLNGIRNKGRNIWIYDKNDILFAGIETEEVQGKYSPLEHKIILIDKYAYYKHIGSYSLIKQAGLNMIKEIKLKGLETSFPSIEIYGHWNKDESRLETEIIMNLGK